MKKILLIDDDRDLSDTVKSVLEYEGYDVLLSHDPEEGIALAKKEKPDLVLMDVMLPGMNGAEAVKILKSDSLTKDTPCIFLTALMTGEEEALAQKGLVVDGQQYQTLAKPFENEKLLEAVKNSCQ